jgi:hypothetical protein
MTENVCRNCGAPLEPGDPNQGLCGDCYWDDQTDADGTINDDDDD